MGLDDKLTLFITGPTFVRDQVKQAALLPDFGHRDTENEIRFRPIFANLRTLWEAGDDYGIVIIPGSGSNAMETSIRSLAGENETVLAVSTGAFGDLYREMAIANLKPGMKVVPLNFDPGKAIDLNGLEDALKQHKPNVVTLTHNETSTGVANPVAEACRLVRQYGAMPLVDGVSIFGGAPTPIEAIGAAMYSTSTQKGLALPAGFGLAAYSREALEKAKWVTQRGYTTDLVAHAKSADKYQTLTTPDCALVNQLMVQLDYIVNTEGVNARFQRHAQMRDITHRFVEGELSSLGFGLFAEKQYASPTVTCIKVPSYFTQKMLNAVKEELRGHGYLMDPGYEKMNAELGKKGMPLTIRVGHMGDITGDMLKTYLGVLKDSLMKHVNNLGGK